MDRAPNVRILIAEELTGPLLDRHADLLRSADACWTPIAMEWAAAERALRDTRWEVGDIPLFDETDRAMGLWAFETANTIGASDERTLVAHGLQARLRSAARARAIVERAVARERSEQRVTVDIVASDPYLRSLRLGAALDHVSVGVRPAMDRSAMVASLRERLAGSAAVRWLAQRLPRRTADPPRIRQGAVALFRSGRGWVDHFEPIARELRARGHAVVVFEYDHLIGEDAEVVDFATAVDATGAPRRILPPRWSAERRTLAGAPVLPHMAARAIRASWTVGAVQIDRHRRVLERWRPSVVVSFGPDTMSLALQAAADRLGIPSLYLPHGYLTPRPAVWSIPATATAVVGAACLEANTPTPIGARSDALVVVGHPQYDEFAGGPGEPRARRSWIGAPSHRPRLVLVFTEWAVDLLDQAMQRRTLEIAGQALPPDAFLVCKLHPGREDRDRSEATLGAVLPRDAFRVVSGRDLSTPALLGVCDAAVATEESMALIDAVLAGRPAIGIRHPENPPDTGPLRHPARRIADVCILVDTARELRVVLERALADPASSLPSPQARESYVRRSLFAIDGWSSVRTADLIEHLGRREDPRTFVARRRSEVIA